MTDEGYEPEDGPALTQEEAQRQAEAYWERTRKNAVDALVRLKDLDEHIRKQRSEWEQKWSLSLAVGNGAGLILLGGALIKGWERAMWLAGLPALWLFLFGVIFAGLLPWTLQRFYRANQDVILKMRAAHEALRDQELAPHLTFEANKMTKVLLRWNLAVKALMASSALSFCAGALWPLTVITFNIGK